MGLHQMVVRVVHPVDRAHDQEVDHLVPITALHRLQTFDPLLVALRLPASHQTHDQILVAKKLR